MDMEPIEPLTPPEAYDAMGQIYADDVEANIWNSLYERPAMQQMIGNVRAKRILDAGCGSGVLTEWLAENGADVVALDASSEMVRITSDRVGDRVQVFQADLARPLDCLEPQSFDVVAASLVLHYMEDWIPTLREFHRVLRSDGHLVFSTHHPFMDFTLFKRPNYFLTELVRDRWEKSNQSFDVYFYRRPLTDLTKAVLNSGFLIDGLEEPQPSPEVAQVSPDDYTTLSTRPWFLLIRGRKASVSQSVKGVDSP
jgi:SAM-dependent methyltransferase